MASETMTVQEARIWVVRNPSGEVKGVSTQDEYRAARDAGWGSHGFAAWDADGSMYSGWTITQEAHARATTAGTGAGGGRVTDDLRELLATCDALAPQSYEWASDDPQYVALVFLRSLREKAERKLADVEPRVDYSQEHVGGYSESFTLCESLRAACKHLTVAIDAIDRPPLAPQEVTAAMVEAARAAFSREWYEDVETRPMRVALTAALAASARGA